MYCRTDLNLKTPAETTIYSTSEGRAPPIRGQRQRRQRRRAPPHLTIQRPSWPLTAEGAALETT